MIYIPAGIPFGVQIPKEIFGSRKFIENSHFNTKSEKGQVLFSIRVLISAD